ncbi:AraC-like DNA-binding protein [Epilithonimonas hungarica]|uniref:helix-turn-helix domain-containing protein n=1 Tax=Epilithonimonas hungarica TaxID=454006 RepID=UPI00277D860E|nr:helix-turn-helix domain-containing protein [Epilithonimonas hungarica]MDP9955333.1 AraC-like DNA-binding protein [Epilithonimonas hungarica]
MKNYFLLFLLFIFLGNAQSNNKREDSIINKLNSLKNPDEKISLTLPLLKENHSESFKAYACDFLANSYIEKGDKKTAVNYMIKAQDFASKSNDLFCKAIIASNIGDLYGRLALYSEAEEYLARAQQYTESLSIPQKRNITYRIYATLGNIYLENNQYDKAIKVHKKFLALVDTGKIYNKKNKECNNLIAFSYNAIGTAYNGKKMYDSAKLYLNKGVEASVKAPNQRYINFLHHSLAETEKNLGNYSQALNHYKIVLTFFPPVEMKSEVFENMRDLYLKLQDTKNAAIYADSARHYKQLISTQNIKGLDTAVNKIKRDKITIITEKENKISNLLYLVLIFGILLIISTFWYFFKLKKQKKLYQEYVKQLHTQHPTQTEAIIEGLSKGKQTLINTQLELDILEKLIKFENEEMFRNKDMSLPKLASHLNTNSNYLSRIINQHYNKNFNGYISELRINYITKKIIENPTYRNYKISFLAEDSGFVSHSAFSTKFKEVTGLSPSQFLLLSSSDKRMA